MEGEDDARVVFLTHQHQEARNVKSESESESKLSPVFLGVQSNC